MKHKQIIARAAILSWAVISLTAARAADAPVEGPAVVGSLTIASADKLKEFADVAGVPLPPFLTAAGVEGMFPFIGDGKLKTDAPVALAMVMGKDVSQQQMMIFALPMKDGGGNLSSIPNTTKTDAADTVTAENGMAFRRTDSYLLFGGTGPVTSKFDVSALAEKVKPGTAADGKSKTPILHLEVDVKKIKQVDPEKFKQGLASSGGEMENAGGKFAQDYMANKIDRLDVDLDQVGGDYDLSAKITPLHADVASFEKAGLPDDCVLRADLGLTVEEAKKAVAFLSKDEKVSDTDMAKVELFETLMLGDSESIGLSPMGGGTLIDVVHQSHSDGLNAKLKSIVDRLKADDHNFGTALSEYQSAAGATVERLTLTDQKDKSNIYADALVKGDALYTTVSFSDAHQAETLVGLKSQGTTMSPASGWIKIPETVKVVQTLQAKAEPGSHPEAIPQAMLDAIGSKPLVWSADNEGDGMRFTIGLPKGMIQAIGKFASTSVPQ
jgi:hypothetical protein